MDKSINPYGVRERRKSTPLERMFRIYGHDFNRAFEALELARTLLDVGSVAQAGTAARYAAYCLRESGMENDRGREPVEIVLEIISVFPSGRRLNFQGLPVFDEGCISEVQTRLGCDRERALGLLKEATNPDRNILDAKVDLTALPAPKLELESGTTDSE